MQTARNPLVAGIIGDCGGNCSCATCLGYLDLDWLAKLEPRGEDEEIILEGAIDMENNSRLFQIKLKAELDGIVVRLPLGQV